MVKQKVLAVTLAALMTMSALTACGSTDDQKSSASAGSEKKTEEAKDKSGEQTAGSEDASDSGEIVFPLAETVEFTGFTVMQGEKLLSEASAWKKLQEMGNVSFELTDVPNGEAGEKASLLLAGGDYPDFFLKSSAIGDSNAYGMEGVYIPLEDLIREYAPNLTKILDERGAWNAISAADGHVYTLPYIDRATMAATRASINKVWLDNLGLDVPTNADELYEVLKAFKEQDADGDGDPNNEIPFCFTASDSWYPVRYLLQYVGDGLQYVSNSYQYFAVIDGEMVNYAVTDSFKNNYIAYLEKLYSEGLIYEQSFIISQEEQNVMEMGGTLFGLSFSLRNKEYHDQYVSLPAFGEGTLSMANGVSSGGMAITDACENPEILVALMDYLYTEEGARLAYMGEEGVAYEIKDNGSWSFLEGVDEYDHVIRGWAYYPTSIPELAYVVDADVDPKGAHNEEQIQIAAAQATIIPKLKLTEEEDEIKSEVWADIKAYIEDYVASVVTGQVDLEESWEEYKATLSAMGMDEMYKVVSDAYQRAIAE